jgi:hypothetical protein
MPRFIVSPVPDVHDTRQVVKEVVVGKGKVNALGLKSSGDAATGFPFFPMIKMP